MSTAEEPVRRHNESTLSTGLPGRQEPETPSRSGDGLTAGTGQVQRAGHTSDAGLASGLGSASDSGSASDRGLTPHAGLATQPGPRSETGAASETIPVSPTLPTSDSEEGTGNELSSFQSWLPVATPTEGQPYKAMKHLKEHPPTDEPHIVHPRGIDSRGSLI